MPAAAGESDERYSGGPAPGDPFRAPPVRPG